MQNPTLSNIIVRLGAQNKEITNANRNTHAEINDVVRSPLRTTSTIPQNAHPKYPAGMIIQRFPPWYFVTPPSLLYTSIASTFPPVIQQAVAWENSWTKTAISFMGFRRREFHRKKLARRYPHMRERNIISSSPQQQSSDQLGLEHDGDGASSSNKSRFSWKPLWRYLFRTNMSVW